MGRQPKPRTAEEKLTELYKALMREWDYGNLPASLCDILVREGYLHRLRRVGSTSRYVRGDKKP